MIQNRGVDKEASYPYTGTIDFKINTLTKRNLGHDNWACRYGKNNIGATISTFRQVNQNEKVAHIH